jgi:hypothetical protein
MSRARDRVRGRPGRWRELCATDRRGQPQARSSAAARVQRGAYQPAQRPRNSRPAPRCAQQVSRSLLAVIRVGPACERCTAARRTGACFASTSRDELRTEMVKAAAPLSLHAARDHAAEAVLDAFRAIDPQRGRVSLRRHAEGGASARRPLLGRCARIHWNVRPRRCAAAEQGCARLGTPDNPRGSPGNPVAPARRAVLVAHGRSKRRMLR